jgi:hypothetical protein
VLVVLDSESGIFYHDYESPPQFLIVLRICPFNGEKEREMGITFGQSLKV